MQPTLDPQKAYMAAEHAALLEAGLSEDLADRAQAFAAQRAWKETDKTTYQAMEAFIHNLNTCLLYTSRCV